MIITEAGADERVIELIYVTSVMPDAGQSQAELIGSEPAPWLQPGKDGTVGVDPDMVRQFFLQDCDESTSDEAVSRLARAQAEVVVVEEAHPVALVEAAEPLEDVAAEEQAEAGQPVHHRPGPRRPDRDRERQPQGTRAAVPP